MVDGKYQLYSIYTDSCIECEYSREGHEESYIGYTEKISYAYDWIQDFIDSASDEDSEHFDDEDLFID